MLQTVFIQQFQNSRQKSPYHQSYFDRTGYFDNRGLDEEAHVRPIRYYGNTDSRNDNTSSQRRRTEESDEDESRLKTVLIAVAIVTVVLIVACVIAVIVIAGQNVESGISLSYVPFHAANTKSPPSTCDAYITGTG